MKIIDLLNKTNKKWYSLEFFPPRTEDGMTNLINKLNFTKLDPLFVDITWGAGGGDPINDNNTGSLITSKNLLYFCKKLIMIHLTCSNYSEEQMEKILDKIKSYGIQNILALKGDSNINKIYAKDLIHQIKNLHKNYFGICVAGYPVGHPNSKNLEMDIYYLKQKVDAGADFIITQLFFKIDKFKSFVKRCRDAEINVPIIPGILPIQSYDSLRHIAKLSNIDVPHDILDVMEKNKNNHEAILNFGIYHATELVKQCLEISPGIHFYTLNKIKSIENIINKLDFKYKIYKNYPWDNIKLSDREKENIRPIFWSNKPESYIIRTNKWTKLHNGYWSNSNSCEYGNLNNYYIFQNNRIINSLKSNWVIPIQSLDDVKNIFLKFINGEIKCIPWCFNNLHDETKVLLDKLKLVIKLGIFPINSQPSLNGVSSNNQQFGWGKKNGFVYQKAYLECFVNKNIIENIKPNNNITYYAIKNDSDNIVTNNNSDDVISLTWGIFPNSQVIQPTIMEKKSFVIWKEEAFSIWKTSWQKFYDKYSEPYNILQEIYDEYYLLVIINNDFGSGYGFEDIISSIV